MKKLIPLLLIVLLLVGCGYGLTRHQKGGGATTSYEAYHAAPRESIEDVEIPGNVNFVGGPGLHMGINQPENPEGVSSMSSKQTKTTIHPDGTVVIDHIETASSIGGSQELKEIVTAYVKSDYFKGLLFAMGLTIAAWMAYRKEWPLAAGIFIAGAIGCVMVTWWLGALSVLAVATLYVGFKIGLPIPPDLLK